MAASNPPSIGWSQFAIDNSCFEAGNSFTELPNDEVIELLKMHWHKRIPGSGESTTDRKVLVPVPVECFFCAPRADLVDGLKIYAEVIRRQEGEEPYIENYTTPKDAMEVSALRVLPAKEVFIVCYSAEALTENNGKRTTDCEFEIVTILCEWKEGIAPMPSLTMARNYLEKDGGTFTDYSAKEFAESIWHERIKKGVKVRSHKE